MIINFRQGIVSYQDGGFLQVDGSGNINLLADQPVIVIIAHKDTDYLHIENEPVNSAWTGPFDPNKKYWLYWDFDLQNFSRTFGYTTLEPVAQNSEPGHGDAEIVEFVPGTGSGGIRINGYFYYLTGKKLTLYNTPGGTNDGTFTVVSSSFNPSTNLTTVVFAETVSSSSPGGFVTTDTDSNGIPLKTEGRHWFDTRNFVHYEFKNGQWVEVLRVFAGVVTNGSIISSPSTNTTTGEFSGSQIGINKDGVRAGRVVFDRDNVPVKRYNKTFFTAEDDFYLNGSRIDRVRLESIVKDFKAGENIGQDAVVAVSHTGDVFLAKYEDVGEKVLGIALNSALFGETVTVAFSGIISSGNWNWLTGPTSVNVGADLWVDNGILVTQDPGVTNTTLHPEKKKPIGRVLSDTEIYFNPLNTGDIINNYFPAGAGGGDPASTSEPGIVFLSYPPDDPNYPVVVTDNDPRLYDARPPLPHTHNAVDIIFNPTGNISALHVQGAIEELDNEKVNILGDTMGGPLLLSRHPLLEMEAATKAYVDSLTSGLIWLNPISLANLISDNVDSPPASPELGDSYIIPPSGGLGSWSSFAPGNVVTWDGTQWVDNGPVTNLDSGSGIRLGVAMTSGTTPSGSFAGQKNNIALFDNSGTLTGFETPSRSNAVYVSRSGSPYEFRQFVFDGTQWKQFGGGGNGITAGNNLYFTGNTLNVLDFSAGGTIDAATLQGYIPADFAPASHTHVLPATNINVNNFTGVIGSLPTDNLQNVLQQLVESKADNTPVWTTLTLPDPTLYQGMLVFNSDVQNDISEDYGKAPVQYSNGSEWLSLAKFDHCHTARYELHWFYDGDFTTLNNGDVLGSIAIIQDTVIIPPCIVASGVPIHDSHLAVSSSQAPQTMEFQIRVLRYSELYDPGTSTFPPDASSIVTTEVWNTITFNFGSTVGEFIMTTDPLVLKKYDVVQLVITGGAGSGAAGFGPLTVTASGATPIGHPVYQTCSDYYTTLSAWGDIVTLMVTDDPDLVGTPITGGTTTIEPNTTKFFVITNYDPNYNYSVSVTDGTVSITDSIITFQSPSTEGTVYMTVTRNDVDVVFVINVVQPYIETPTIIDPTNGATNISTNYTIVASSFNVINGTDTHISSDWQLATDSSFTNIIAQSLNDSTNLTSWPVSLSTGTTYYVRVRYNGATYGSSDWSTPVSFTTAATVSPPTSNTASLTGGSLATPGDQFGRHVAINSIGTRMFVGTIYYDNGGLTDIGSVYVFDKDPGTGSWVQQTIITPSDAESGDLFGIAVVSNNTGDRIAVGSFYDNNNGITNNGAVYIYDYDSVTDTWTETAKIINPYGSFTRFGETLAMSGNGNRLFVGAADEPINGGSGVVYIYNFDGTNWLFDTKLEAQPHVSINEKFAGGNGTGISVNDAGDVLIVGAYGYNSYEGAIFVFNYDGTNWNLNGPYSPGIPNSGFGINVGINADGTKVVVGAQYEDTDGTDNGAVYVGDINTSYQLVNLRKIPTPPEIVLSGTTNNLFGSAVHINSTGDIIIVGAHGSSYYYANSGLAFVGKYDSATDTWTLNRLDVGGTLIHVNLGYSVKVNDLGDRAFVSAIHSTLSTDYGQVYVFES